MDILLDSGSTVSLVRNSILPRTLGVKQLKPGDLQLVSAAGEPMPVVGQANVVVQVGQLSVEHPLVVVDSLISPVILGMDFLQQHGLVLDFASSPISVTTRHTPPNSHGQLQDIQPIVEDVQKAKAKICAVYSESSSELTEEVVDDCAIPRFSTTTGPDYDMPQCSTDSLSLLLNEYQELFRTSPGCTTAAEHFIPTSGTPVKVPPRRVPANYRVEVERQIEEMLAEGIIEESSSAWLAPAVFVRKKTGDIRLCVDYRELNKRTTKDAYPLPRPDEVQDQLAGSQVFSTLDLQCGYWQLPVHTADRDKTAFSPGPGMGLFQFRRMPFGLSGAPASFQRLMDKVCRGLSFTTTYLDDVLVHSASMQEHAEHLRLVFERLASAGLTLRGRKCRIGMAKVNYLGHVFSAAGMEPDPQKVAAVHDWTTPTNVSDLRSFLGLASYYRRYIPRFADIAAPLHHLTEKGATFRWDPACQTAFDTLKEKLTQAPILTYPEFLPSSEPFSLQTDASAVGIGVVLEQAGHVVAYASRSLTQSERNYSVIQRECLAVVYGLKQFRHYLLGRPFYLLTDHAPLQWLSAQKMDGLLARWTLAIQEYDMTIMYRKGSLSNNADSLSRRPAPVAATTCTSELPDLLQHQGKDPIIRQLRESLQPLSPPHGPAWRQPSFRRYRQIWSQLTLQNGLVCRQYAPGPTSDTVLVPVIPASLRSLLIKQHHDAPGAGHLGPDKTAGRIRLVGYWVGMLQDIEEHCRQCAICQSSKLPAPTRAPLQNVPVGRPWEMVAVDILQVPLSYRNNRYLLVIQDYFTKWAEAIPLQDQTADRITKELTKVFTTFGVPDILHSDQGRNFESAILRQTLDAFGVTKSRTTAYHPQGDGMVERFNRSLLQMLRAYVQEEADWERFLPLVLYAYRTAVHSSTGFAPFELMFGRTPQKPVVHPHTAHDPSSYHDQLQAKLAQLRDFVETYIAESAHHQKTSFDRHAQIRTFQVGDSVWLSIPTAGKLDPRWEGKWVVHSIPGPTSYTITDGKRFRTVHVNRLQQRIQPDADDPQSDVVTDHTTWQPPSVEHQVITEEEIVEPHLDAQAQPIGGSRYPSRVRQPPERLRF